MRLYMAFLLSPSDRSAVPTRAARGRQAGKLLAGQPGAGLMKRPVEIAPRQTDIRQQVVVELRYRVHRAPIVPMAHDARNERGDAGTPTTGFVQDGMGCCFHVRISFGENRRFRPTTGCAAPVYELQVG